MSAPAPGTGAPPRQNPGARSFWSYWTEYVNGWVAAAVVLPTAITWKGMPVYESQRNLLSTLSALSCTLTLAFLFTSRDLIPKTKSRYGRIFSILVSLSFIAATLWCASQYLDCLKSSAEYAQKTLNVAMSSLSMDEIPDGKTLIWNYLGMIVFAECAFFFMAFREWKSDSDSTP